MTAVRLSWWAKNLDERKIALNELRFSRVGRRARLKGEVVTITSLARELEGYHPNLLPSLPGTPHPRMLPLEEKSGLTQRQYAAFRRDFPNLDLEEMERKFRAYLADRELPDDYVKALYGFARKKAAELR